MNATFSSDNFSRLILSLLPAGHPSIITTAQHCGVSVRTLQHNLKKSGIIYSELVMQIRFEAACRMLQQSHNNINDVSSALYMDSSNLSA